MVVGSDVFLAETLYYEDDHVLFLSAVCYSKLSHWSVYGGKLLFTEIVLLAEWFLAGCAQYAERSVQNDCCMVGR